MNRYWIMPLLLVALVISVPSCDSGSESGRIFNAAPPSTPMDELSDEEAYDLCLELEQALNNAVSQEEICMMYAINVGISQDLVSPELACEFAYEDCMDGDEEPLIECDDQEGISEEVEDCDATVGEMEQCVQDWIDAWNSATIGLDCSDESADPPEEPASCQALPDDCPDLGELMFGDYY